MARSNSCLASLGLFYGKVRQRIGSIMCEMWEGELNGNYKSSEADASVVVEYREICDFIWRT